MAMTEKQGGSDVRANTTRASPVDDEKGPGKGYALTGHKVASISILFCTFFPLSVSLMHA